MQKRNFNKKDISNEIYKKLGFSKNFSSGFIDTFLESIISEVIKNDNYLSAFDKIKERILSKNISKPYPDINDIPK